MNNFINLNDKNIEELKSIAQKIRVRILEVVSKNGGHLSSTLGATDIIVAMHKVFDCKKNPFIFDVSHQAYAHKLLTGRWDYFQTLRKFNGLCGYTKPKESEYDYYVAGHSSTSISLGVGVAKSILLKNETDRVPIVLIGDGSMSAGMVYEAMNELGEHKYPMVIILNDNEMSISKPIGALSRILSKNMASPFYQKFKSSIKNILEPLPKGASYLAKRLENSLSLITPGLLFEELGLEYIGPIDGHNIELMVETLNIAKNMKKPIILHMQTLKGKGYPLAEGQNEKWHGIGAFNLETGESNKKSTKEPATSIFSNYLLSLSDKNKKIVGVTAAMPDGTGMNSLIQKYPDRFWDVAIAEQHAITSMGSLAKEGFKPFCAIYSTFLQRGYDQLIHDICLMNLPVVFAIDRAGIVGEDGETHQGVFDISFLRPIPNLTICAPYNNKTMKLIMDFAETFPTPLAFRYPRGSFIAEDRDDDSKFELGKSKIIEKGDDILFIGYGNGVGRAIETSKLLTEKVTILDLRFIKPLDEENLILLSKTHKKWFIFSDSVKIGGIYSAILEFLNEYNIKDILLKTFEYQDKFITHGDTKLVEKSLNITPEQLIYKIN